MGLDMYLKQGKLLPRKSVKESIKIANKLDIYTTDKSSIPVNIIKKYGDYILEDYTYADLYQGRPNYVMMKQVGYWRKANHIHHWFVQNVQGGKDDCNTYNVTKEDLLELNKLCDIILNKCELVDGEVTNGHTYEMINGKFTKVANVSNGKVISNHEIAEMVLPTQKGFFFGGTDYDEWYYEDVKETKKIIERVLAEVNFDTDYLVYRSSW